MKPNELRQKSKEELDTLLAQMRGRMAELRELVQQKKVKNVKEVPAVKRDIARIMTLLKQRESATVNR